MGNSTQTIKSQDLLDNYLFIRQISQGSKLYKNKKTQKQYITIQRTFPTSDMLINYQRKITKLLEMKHPYFLNQTEHAIITSSTLCSMQYKVIHFFQYEPHTLQAELQARKAHERYFDEKEIWSILCSSVLAMSYLTKQDILCYTLHPRDICIDKLGMIKILSPLITDQGLEVLQEGFYYSPEHLKELKSCNFSQVSNKSSVFTLGITLLHILSLEPMNQLYDYQNFTINMELLNQIIDKISEKEIKEVLSKMLKFHSYDRITFTELQEMLYDILQAKPIQTNDSTLNQKQAIDKIQRSINKIYQKDQQFQENTLPVTYKSNQHNKFEQKSSLFLTFNTNFITCEADKEDENSNLVNQSCLDHENFDQKDTIEKNDGFGKLKSSKVSCKADSRRLVMNEFNKTCNVLQERNHPNISTSENSLHQSNQTKYEIEKLKSYHPKTNTSNQQNRLDFQQTSRPHHIREQLSIGIYEGYKINNYRHGYGVFYYIQGGRYVGQWFKNKMQGRGALYYANGQIAYQGEWLNDRLHGFGILYNQTPVYTSSPINYKCLHLIENLWTKYEGNFYQDEKNGEGTLFLSNGEHYRGCFKGGLPHGDGIYKFLNGSVLKGTWILGVMR